jgi:hypothetical protein
MRAGDVLYNTLHLTGLRKNKTFNKPRFKPFYVFLPLEFSPAGFPPGRGIAPESTPSAGRSKVLHVDYLLSYQSSIKWGVPSCGSGLYLLSVSVHTWCSACTTCNAALTAGIKSGPYLASYCASHRRARTCRGGGTPPSSSAFHKFHISEVLPIISGPVRTPVLVGFSIGSPWLYDQVKEWNFQAVFLA